VEKTYTYSTAIPHAVTSVTDKNAASLGAYTYDQNGNMTCRVEAGVTYKQVYNAENRISSIMKLRSGTCTDASPVLETKWDFAYDGDGTRMATLVTPYDETTGLPLTSSFTAYYFGGAYETRSDGAIFKYYSFSGQSIVNEYDPATSTWELSYLLTDHLSSVVAVTDGTGALLSQQRYLPFGGERTNLGTISQTDYGYTGQRDLEMGLMDYKARFYSPLLGRFTQPDTLIPDSNNPQALNRFSYVMNRPINYNDPTGHCNSNMSLLLPGYTAVKCAVEDIGDAIATYKSGEHNFFQLAAKATGFDDAARRAGNRINQLNGNISTVFSNAPVKDRFWASVDVGLTSVNIAATLVGIGQMAVAAKTAMLCSFSPETIVETKDGKKAISAIEVGDYVLAWNEADGTLNFYEVTATLAHLDTVLTELVINGEWIETTPEHPFYTEEKGWIPAGDLKSGMHIRQADGDYELVWFRWSIARTQVMYNLTVDTAHTFFVGDSQWLVHNSCGDRILAEAKRMGTPEFGRTDINIVNGTADDAVQTFYNFTNKYKADLTSLEEGGAKLIAKFNDNSALTYYQSTWYRNPNIPTVQVKVPWKNPFKLKFLIK